MAQRLLVKEAFGDYAPGDRITKSADMARVVKSHPDYVLREDVPDKTKAKAGRKTAKTKSKAKVSTPGAVVAAPLPPQAPRATTQAQPAVTKNVVINDISGGDKPV